MRLEAILWSLVVVYFATIGIVYIAFGGEPAGIALLLAGAGLGGLVAGWTWDWTRRNAPRVEDQADTDASDLSGIVGVYQHHDYADEKRAAWAAWAAHVMEVVGEDFAGVLPFRGAEQ